MPRSALVLGLAVATLLASVPATAQELRPHERVGNVELGAAGAFAHRADMWMLGVRGGVRGIGMPWVEAAATMLGGLGVEHFTARASLHLRLALTVEEDWRFYALGGPALYGYAPRGEFAEWCDKLQLDCRGIVGGVEAGIGAAWRAVALEAYLGTGDLPFLTVVLSGSVVL